MGPRGRSSKWSIRPAGSRSAGFRDPVRIRIEPLEDQGPLTLVAFSLEPVAEGTRLRLVESGFASLSDQRRATAFGENDEGWGECLAEFEDSAKVRGWPLRRSLTMGKGVSAALADVIRRLGLTWNGTRFQQTSLGNAQHKGLRF